MLTLLGPFDTFFAQNAADRRFLRGVEVDVFNIQIVINDSSGGLFVSAPNSTKWHCQVCVPHLVDSLKC